MIEVKNLTKRYGDHLAVDHLSFTVQDGQIYGFLGPNGAGKSTTMNMMTGYLGITEGQIIVNGHDVLEEPQEAKACIGYLPEMPPVYTDMTVQEYLKFCAELKRIPKAERAGEIERAMAKTDIVDVSERMIKNLSKGYRQRVGLAQAILGMPPIIILDEPTVGLDPRQIMEIRDLIRSLAGEHTIILSSHIMQEISAVCDHVMIIAHGKLVASDTTENLLKMGTDGNNLEMYIRGTEEQIRPVLEAFEDIRSLTVTRMAEDTVKVNIQTPREIDLREDIFYEMAKRRHPIVHMTQEVQSLEELFLELTGNDAAAADGNGDEAGTSGEGGRSLLGSLWKKAALTEADDEYDEDDAEYPVADPAEGKEE